MVHIITDSGCMLSVEEAETLGITMCPLAVTLDGGNPRLEIYEVKDDEFLESVKAGHIPFSSQPSPGAYFDAIKAHPNDEIVIITIGDFISGSNNSAHIARDMDSNPDRIHIVDCQSIAGPQFGVVTTAARMAQKGCSAAEILAVVNEQLEINVSYLAPSDINFIANGGRLPKKAVPVAKMLHAIPVLTFSERTIKKYAIKLGFDSVIKTTIHAIERAYQGIELDYYISHSDIPEIAEQAQKILKEKYHASHIHLRTLSPVGITHAGPKAFVLQATKHVDLSRYSL